MKFNQEWDFITTEVHGEKPSKTNLSKREILFALQILLTKIGRTTEISKMHFLRENYFSLKEAYFLA